MKRLLPHRRGASVAALTTLTALALTTSALAAGPTQAAAPAAAPTAAGDCAAPFPVADLAAGDPVTGLTVTSGTTPGPFTGEVIGVLDDGIAPDVDMVMMRLTSTEIDRVGIWQGMSGSPVYAADGRLIGAVAYGLSYGPSPVAGITPYADMDDYLDADAPGRVEVGAKAARAIARSSDVTTAQAEQGLRQLKMPLGVSGLGARRLAQISNAKHAPSWLAKDTYAIGSSAAPGAAPGADTVVAGGNLAASLSYGDVTMAGVGTATSVCDDAVVGFGHPMTFAGETSMSLHPADALYIQEDSLGAPFKVANLGAPVGTISDDHLTGISGRLGATPPTATVSSTVTYRDRSRTGTTQVSVPAFMPDVTFYQVVGNHDRTIDGLVDGTELSDFTIRGTDADGGAFALQSADRFTSSDDVSVEPGFDVADVVYALTALPGVSVDSVDVTSTVNDSTAEWEVTGIEARRGDSWTRVTKKAPLVARAGSTLRARAVLTGTGGSVARVPVSFAVPRKAAGTNVILQMLGGSSIYSDTTSFDSVAEARRMLNQKTRNDAVVAELATRDSISQYGDDSDFFFFRGNPRRPVSFDSVKRLRPTERVVSGTKKVRVKITPVRG